MKTFNLSQESLHICMWLVCNLPEKIGKNSLQTIAVTKNEKITLSRLLLDNQTVVT